MDEQQQMDGAQMEEDEEEVATPNANGAVPNGMSTDDYEEIDYKICGELGKKSYLNYNIEEKNRALDEFALTQTPEGAIEVRIQQLALCKVLVNIHKRDLFILVKAYTNLGEAYLNNKYYEQSLDHLTTALKLNGSLFSKLEETKQFHSHILTLLGK
jgi:hypothetical protein